jgi:hypothetical protein
MPRIRHLSGTSAAILRAVIAAIRPRARPFDAPIDEDVLAEVDATLPYLPATLRLGFPLGLRLLEWGPIVFAGRPGRMSRMPPDEARRYLAGWLESRVAPRRMLVLGIRALVYLAFYQHPSIQKALGVDWQGRVGETLRLRAATIGEIRDWPAATASPLPPGPARTS